MRAAPFQITPPDGPLIPTTDLRGVVRMETDERDGDIEAALSGAVALLDGYRGRLGRCILAQRWALPLVGRAEAVLLPFPDCRDPRVERLVDGAWVEGAGLFHSGQWVALSDMPDDFTGLHLTVTVGYETPADVPGDIMAAVRLLVAHLFDYDPRAWGVEVGNLPANVEAMIAAKVWFG